MSRSLPFKESLCLKKGSKTHFKVGTRFALLCFVMSKHITKYISPYFSISHENDNLVLSGVVAGIKRNELNISSNDSGFILKVLDDPSFNTQLYCYKDESDEFDLSASKAKLEDGILTIRVPQRQERKPRQIHVE